MSDYPHLTPGDRVMVCGSRGWKESHTVLAVMAELPEGVEVMHGGADGADLDAYWACLDLGIKAYPFLPDNTRPRPQRYHERNDRMLERAQHVIAFWDGTSRGTKSVVEKARRRGIPVQVVSPALSCEASA